MSFLLALVSGALALVFVLAITPLQAAITFSMGWIPSASFVALVSNAFLAIASVPLVVSIYFLIYYLLPNGKVPVSRVLPACDCRGYPDGNWERHLFPDAPDGAFSRRIRALRAFCDVAFLGLCRRSDSAFRRPSLRARVYIEL